jgi:glycosyltransferase involved in cell wall biosynthesis
VKFALFSEYLPPSVTSPGQAGIIYRLLETLPPDAYCLISRADFDAEPYRGLHSRLPGTYHALSAGGAPPNVNVEPGAAVRSSILDVPRRIVDIVRRAREIAAIARNEECDAVVACPDRVGDLPTAYLASRLAGVRFYPYLFDDYSTWYRSGVAGLLARHAERVLLKGAAGVIVPNEALRDSLRRRYEIEATVIRNSCDLSAYEGPARAAIGPGAGELKIVFTGAIYDAHYEGIRALLAALRLRGDNARLHVYTPMPYSVLSDRGLHEGIVYHGRVPSDAVPEVQQAADVLFLPLAFESPFPEVIRTSAPAKMGEYLASTRPILVHAPADSFAAQYFRRHECGLVVSERDPALLAQAVDRICEDAALRERLRGNAWQRAREDFDLAQARAAFLHCLSDSR